MTDPVATEHFLKWTGSRKIASIGTNDGAPPLAFQGWHRFKEAFPPELVYKAVSASTRTVKRCFDPFGGSGTTALACQMLGLESITVEVNPFLADVIRAKLARYDTDRLARCLAAVRRRTRNLDVDAAQYFAYTPKTFLRPGVKDRWLFNDEIASRLAALLTTISRLQDPDIRRLFRILVGGMVVEISNAVTSGKGRRYRRNWQDANVDASVVERLFAARAESAILDIHRFSARPDVLAEVIEGDARSFQPTEVFDLAIFSPPYPNSFDYTDVYNLELWALGYLQHSGDNRNLRNATLSSHVQLHRSYADPPEGSRTLKQVLQQLCDARANLWNRWIPEMVGAYFADLNVVLDRLSKNLLPGGQCWIVVGDSSYAGVSVPVAKILTEIAAFNGWHSRAVEAFRHMRSSVQQGWNPDLAETLLILEKAS